LARRKADAHRLPHNIASISREQVIVLAKRPFSWFVGVNKSRVVKDLENNPDLEMKLGRYRGRFIKWCAKERTIYEEDIFDEVNTFIEKYINSRLCNLDNKLWKSISKEILERDNYTCRYCGKIGGKLEVDHIVPISKGGTNELNNLTAACLRCNRQKRDKMPEEFEAWKLSRA